MDQKQIKDDEQINKENLSSKKKGGRKIYAKCEIVLLN